MKNAYWVVKSSSCAGRHLETLRTKPYAFDTCLHSGGVCGLEVISKMNPKHFFSWYPTRLLRERSKSQAEHSYPTLHEVRVEDDGALAVSRWQLNNSGHSEVFLTVLSTVSQRNSSQESENIIGFSVSVLVFLHSALSYLAIKNTETCGWLFN